MVRTIAISGHYAISVRNDQLLLKPISADLKEAEIACIDIGFLILEHPHISITQHAIATLAEYNVAVIFVGADYLPVSMLFHLETHGVQAEKFSAQINSSEPLRKQLWAQTVKAKIENQALLLKYFDLEFKDVLALSTKVKSGDIDNLEGQAARRYWPRLFNEGFVRDRFGEPPNHLLNYGYTILRAATVRALCGKGLYPLMGIHHKSRYNHFALADDMMEPFRPFIDWEIRNMLSVHELSNDLLPIYKTRILKLLASDVYIDGTYTNLNNALEIMCASLAKCFENQNRKLKLPNLRFEKEF